MSLEAELAIFLADVRDNDILDRAQWDATEPDIQYGMVVRFAKECLALKKLNDEQAHRLRAALKLDAGGDR